MTMPEAPMNEDDSMEFGKHHVRFSGQLGVVETIAKTAPI
jgi:hypothetical protein